jgi:hypothetical protein
MDITFNPFGLGDSIEYKTITFLASGCLELVSYGQDCAESEKQIQQYGSHHRAD